MNEANLPAVELDDRDVVAESRSSFDLLMNPESFKTVQTIAEQLVKSSVGKNIKGNVGDAFAVTLDALSKGLNPFQVAGEAHISQSGIVSYSAKVVNAVIISKAPIKKRPEFVYIGDWTKILGKVEERKSDSGGKYYVATWKPADEVGLGVQCVVALRNEDSPRVLELMMSQCWPRFSTQWATDPKQQICYAAVRKWGRLYSPDVMLGMYSSDELPGDDRHAPKDMGAAEVVDEVPSALLDAAKAAAKKGVAAYQKFFAGTGADNRKALAAEHQGLKDMAVDADRARTVESAPTATQAPVAAATADTPANVTQAADPATGEVDPAFVAAMEAAETKAGSK